MLEVRGTVPPDRLRVSRPDLLALFQELACSDGCGTDPGHLAAIADPRGGPSLLVERRAFLIAGQRLQVTVEAISSHSSPVL